MTNNASSREDEWYWEAIISLSSDVSELLLYYLFERGADGVEELVKSGENLKIKVYFSSRVVSPLKVIEDIFDEIKCRPKFFEVNSLKKEVIQDWRENWKDYFRPLIVGRSFVVRPPWEDSSPEKREIVIYPGRGFGTGYHESTRLALESMEWLGEQYEFKSVIDVGTGSGILSIASLLLTAERVTAIDIDRDALEEVPKNLALSGIDPELCSVMLKEPGELSAPADLVIANIEENILKHLIDDLERLAQKDGYLIFSGLLIAQKEDFLRGLPDSMTLVKESRLNEWVAFILRKK